MNNKLQILSSYLPYGVQMEAPKNYNFDGHRHFDKIICTVEGVKGGYVKFEGLPAFHPIDNFKLVLRPMSDVKKPIIHDGVEVDVMAEIKNHPLRSETTNEILGMIVGYIEEAPYWLVQTLLKYHFNVFNLPTTEFIIKTI